MGKVLIIGSSNIDMVAKVDHLPVPGETVGNAEYFQAFGGKGANQAVAASRSGGDTVFITAVGNDSGGRDAINNFKKEGLEISASKICKKTPTGTALIFVDKNAENCIVVAPGANREVSVDLIEQHEDIIAIADILVMQMEIPYESVKRACEIAKKHNTQIFLNPAPALSIDDNVLSMTDWLVLNEFESEIVSGLKISYSGIEKISESLYNKGVKNVIVTLGKKGCYVKTEALARYFSAYEVDAVDTTAAGDTFCGVFATCLTKGDSIIDAISFASASSAIAVTRRGAQPSIPRKEEVNAFLEKNNKTPKN